MKRTTSIAALCLLLVPAVMAQHTHEPATANAPLAAGPAGNHHDMMFADGMIRHHQDGIEMARMALDKAQGAELRTMAQKMVDDQTKEIGQLRALRPAGAQHGMEEMRRMMPGMMPESEMQKDMARLRAATGTAFDLAFTEIMARHHQGAIAMAGHEISMGASEGMKDLARNLAEKQRAERQQLLAMNDSLKSTQSSMTSAAGSRERMTKD